MEHDNMRGYSNVRLTLVNCEPHTQHTERETENKKQLRSFANVTLNSPQF